MAVNEIFGGRLLVQWFYCFDIAVLYTESKELIVSIRAVRQLDTAVASAYMYAISNAHDLVCMPISEGSDRRLI